MHVHSKGLPNPESRKFGSHLHFRSRKGPLNATSPTLRALPLLPEARWLRTFSSALMNAFQWPFFDGLGLAALGLTAPELLEVLEVLETASVANSGAEEGVDASLGER